MYEEREEIVYSGISTGESDIYAEIEKAIGVDIRNNPDYRIASTGAEDNMGISETVYTPFQVIKKTKVYTGGSTDQFPVPGDEDPEIEDSTAGTETPTDEDPEIEDPTAGAETPTDEDPEIEVDDIEKATTDYLNDNEQKESVHCRVSRKYTNAAKKWLIMLALILMLLSGFGKDKVVTTEGYKETVVNPIETIQVVNDLEYKIVLKDGSELILEQQDLMKVMGEHQIGSDVTLKEKDVLFSSSTLTGKKSVIGTGFRQEGTYQISGVSVVQGHDILEHEVDLFIQNPGLNIADYVNDVCAKHGIDPSQVQIRLHIGNSANFTRTGWIDATQLFTLDRLDQATLDQIVSNYTTYGDTVNNFSGSTVTIQTENGDVTIDVKDENGNFLAPGTKVIGSDGNEYMIVDLDCQSKEIVSTSYETVTVDKEREVTNEKLTWKIQNCNLALGIAPLLAALALDLAAKKKNEESEKNPNFYEFENEEEYQKFKKEFEEEKEKFDNISKFKRAIKEIFYLKEIDLLRRLTSEQTRELYSAIMSCNCDEYTYNPTDKIEFKKGRIIAVRNGGQSIDITNIVMDQIYSIGKDNSVEAEGLLPEEYTENKKK